MSQVGDLLEFVADDGFGPLTPVEQQFITDILTSSVDPLRVSFLAGRLVQAAAMLAAAPISREVAVRSERIMTALHLTADRERATNLELIFALVPLLLEIGAGLDRGDGLPP